MKNITLSLLLALFIPTCENNTEESSKVENNTFIVETQEAVAYSMDGHNMTITIIKNSITNERFLISSYGVTQIK